MKIIPAIDIIDGKCVRLTQGDYLQKKVYATNPLDVAKTFADNGIQRLHLVDLDGAKIGKIVNFKVLESIANNTNLSIDFGGGVKQTQDVNSIFNAGAHFVTIGSLAVKNEQLFTEWIDIFGANKFLLGADVVAEKIAIHGWQEKTSIDLFEFINKYFALGINNIFCTDIAKDGKMQGPSIELYKKIIKQFPSLHFIASGGVSNLQDLQNLQAIGCAGAIVGKAYYEGKISIQELQKFA